MKFVVNVHGMYFKKFFASYSEALQFAFRDLSDNYPYFRCKPMVFPVPDGYKMKETHRWSNSLNGSWA